VSHCLRDPVFSRFSRKPTRGTCTDRQTDRQTHDNDIYRDRIASRGKMYENDERGSLGIKLNKQCAV